MKGFFKNPVPKKSGQKIIDDIKEFEAENRLDPRQQHCWAYFIDPESETYSNCYRSGLKAGYSQSYCRTLRGRSWFKDKMRRTHLLSKSEKVINKILDLESDKADVMRIQADTAKHITKTLGKDEGYSERTEQVGGGNIVFLHPYLTSL